MKDTLFGPEAFRSIYGGSNQINSIETLYGALARVVGLEATTVTWLLAAPRSPRWRSGRCGALPGPGHPARRSAVHLVAALMLFLSADTRMGDLGVPRMGQGKSVALLVVVPLIWVWRPAGWSGGTAGRPSCCSRRAPPSPASPPPQ